MVLRICCAVICVLLVSCNSKPTHAELEVRYTRRFYSESSELELFQDHHFEAWHEVTGPLTGAPVRERCSGSWEIKSHGDTYNLIFLQGERLDLAAGNCSDSFEIWSPGNGYFSAEDTICILHPITRERICINIEP